MFAGIFWVDQILCMTWNGLVAPLAPCVYNRDCWHTDRPELEIFATIDFIDEDYDYLGQIKLTLRSLSCFDITLTP